MINTEIWEPVPEKPGYVQAVGQRKTEDVFRELLEFLQKEKLMPEEYFLMSAGFAQRYPLFPKTDDFRCYAQWGASEGIYLEVELLVRNEGVGKMEAIPFATGKTLDESPEGYDRMQYIAGRIYRVFTSDDYVPQQTREMQKDPGKVEADGMPKEHQWHGEAFKASPLSFCFGKTYELLFGILRPKKRSGNLHLVFQSCDAWHLLRGMQKQTCFGGKRALRAAFTPRRLLPLRKGRCGTGQKTVSRLS